MLDAMDDAGAGTSLDRILQRLAPAVLRPAVTIGDEQLAAAVADVVLHDGSPASEVGQNDLVLGVGWRTAQDAVDALSSLGARRPAAVVVRDAIAGTTAVRNAADEAGVPLLCVEEGASWMQLTLLLRELVEGSGKEPALLGGAGDDLFRLANAIAALVDAPVTIEDPHARVLAFSEGQERADPARMATILGRRAPEEFYSRMKKYGVYKRLHAATAPIVVPGRAPDVLPRVVMPVRASGEFLGSIWVAVEEALDAEKEAQLELAGRTVALHLIRQRLTSDAWRTAEVAAVSALLEGGSQAQTTARRLALDVPAYQVVAVAGAPDRDLDAEAILLRLWDGLRISLTTLHRQALIGRVDDAVYVIVPLLTAKHVGAPHPDVRAFFERFLTSHPELARSGVRVALGSAVAGVGQLPLSRDQADRVMRVMTRHQVSRPVADVVELGTTALVDLLVDATDVDPSLGSHGMASLIAYDEAKGTQFAATVEAWLDAFGDTDVAAEALSVHPNTVRYRIRQLRELQLVALDSPQERLALLVHMQRARRQRS